MRISFLLVSALLGATAIAQTPNVFEIYPGATDFTTRRGVAGQSFGDVVQSFPANNFNRMCQIQDPANPNASIGRVNGFQVVIQDQNAATQETYDVVLLNEDPANPGRPDPDPTKDLLRTAPVLAPTGTGTLAWIITLTLTTPYSQLSPTKPVFVGVGLQPNAAWTADGLSVHMSDATTGGPSGTGSNKPRQGAPGTTYGLDRGTNQAGVATVNGPNTNTFRIHLMTLSPVFNVGANIDPTLAGAGLPASNYGTAGLFPSHAVRGDGLAFRVRSVNHPTTSVFILGTFPGFGWGAGVPFPSLAFHGLLALDPAALGATSLVFAQGTTNAGGVLDIVGVTGKVSPWITNPGAGCGVDCAIKFRFQAILFGSLVQGFNAFSNGAAID